MKSDQMLLMLSNINMEETNYLTNLMKDRTEEEKVEFLTSYNYLRKDPMMILVCSLIGFAGVAGIQRFLVDDILMGILYLVTGGFCLIGTIIDAVRYRDIAFQYNSRVAAMVASNTLNK